jgi:uric acid-xanthine permease
MGTSFTFLPIFEIGIRQQVFNGVDPQVAYGAMLGTSMFCCLLEIFFSFMPLKWIKTIFPPVVTSITVMLIGGGSFVFASFFDLFLDCVA